MLKKLIWNACARIANVPFRNARHAIASPPSISHSQWVQTLSEQFNKSHLRVLEIGSRKVTWAEFSKSFDKCDYVGFDIYDGPNVDVVGDCHKLSSYFEEKFDLIFSSVVFEHLAMPWIAAEEIAKTLKVGGCAFIETHFSFSSHERPWHFFQYSDMGLRTLFNSELGFDLVEKGMSNPISGYFSAQADDYLRNKPVPELYCHSEILVKKSREISDFDWREIDLAAVVEGTSYPNPI